MILVIFLRCPRIRLKPERYLVHARLLNGRRVSAGASCEEG